MIDLKNGQITDLLPDTLGERVEIKCLSHAIMMAYRKMLRYADGTMLLASIDTMPAKILDALAVELRAAYYLESMSLQSKRETIKNAFINTLNGGTKRAVLQVLSTVFGQGTVTEWFDDNGSGIPGTFDVDVESQISADDIDTFNGIIGDVKNIRSHIGNISASRPLIAKAYVGCAFRVASSHQGIRAAQ